MYTYIHIYIKALVFIYIYKYTYIDRYVCVYRTAKSSNPKQAAISQKWPRIDLKEARIMG